MFETCCEQSNYKMSKTQNVILRVTIVLGIIVGVVAVLYLTPLPEKYFKSCDRPCHDLDWPMICRIKIYVETPENSRQCENCTLNDSREVIAVNRQVPGPSIQICQNDILVVDVVNKIPGHTLTVHWRGQPNNEAPYMDGVPLVTQCPIHSYSTFQYKFKVTTPGTHLYHAYSDKDRSQGMFGALIVRQPEKIDLSRKHYDTDSKNHIILISEGDKKLLINGEGPSTAALSIFNVQMNKQYRFRVAFAGGDLACPVTLSIDDHFIKIIALDGNPISPIVANSLIFSKGERVDFVVKTTQDINSYFLRVKSCIGDGLALLNYEGKKHDLYGVHKEAEKVGRIFDTSLCESKVGRFCLRDVKSLQKISEELKIKTKALYLSFGSKIVNFNDKFSLRIFEVNNLTFTYPSSPLLTQVEQVDLDAVCDKRNLPKKCMQKEICECVHVEYIPLGSSVELILNNQDSSNDEHVFHLHGYRFNIVGFRQFATATSEEEIKLLDQQHVLFKRNFNNPVLKDTVRVPRNGVVSLRFLADNPGFWILRDEKSKGWTRGLDVIFQVGDVSDFPSIPSEFPTCGNYMGPDFFLM